MKTRSAPLAARFARLSRPGRPPLALYASPWARQLTLSRRLGESFERAGLLNKCSFLRIRVVSTHVSPMSLPVPLPVPLPEIDFFNRPGRRGKA